MALTCRPHYSRAGSTSVRLVKRRRGPTCFARPPQPGEDARGPSFPGSSQRSLSPGGEALVGVVGSEDGQPQLLEVVLALQATGCLADLLDGREDQADQH